MINLKGINGTAKVFTDNVEQAAIDQIIGMLNSDITNNKQVRIMPDVHAGKGSTIGTTIMGDIDRISPNIVGVDIGCGISMWKLDVLVEDINLPELDRKAIETIPTGFSVHEMEQEVLVRLEDLTFEVENRARVLQSIGTLGGGNHYLEMAADENGEVWLSVHTGSRGLGVQVAKHHQALADEQVKIKRSEEIVNTIDPLKAAGRFQEIEATVIKLRESYLEEVKDMASLTGDKLTDYLNDMVIAQEYAIANRRHILENLVQSMGWSVLDRFDSMHNYVDTEHQIVRKGATSARLGERLVIPLNMRDGSLICKGRGNVDWNFSAPHGAGRAMSRSQARREIDLDTYKNQMKEIYSTSVTTETLDEAPDAYKPASEIMKNIQDTVEIVHHIKPIWNMKAK